MEICTVDEFSTVSIKMGRSALLLWPADLTVHGTLGMELPSVATLSDSMGRAAILPVPTDLTKHGSLAMVPLSMDAVSSKTGRPAMDLEAADFSNEDAARHGADTTA